MPATFLQQKKKTRYLTFVLIVLILAILFTFYFGFFKKTFSTIKLEPVKPPEIVINFKVLDNPILKELEPFEKIRAFEGEVGRENPFIKY